MGGTDGDIYFWNVFDFQCLKKMQDADGWNGTKIALSTKYLISGNNSGYIYIYHLNDKKPFKKISNLTTKITDIKINHNQQLLIACSKFKKDSLRLIHLPSGTVYSNWPYLSTPLNYVNICAFSTQSKYLACGNARGIALLYRLIQFK